MNDLTEVIQNTILHPCLTERPNSEGEYNLKLTEDQLKKLQKVAIYWIMNAYGSVNMDYVSIAFTLKYEPNYFLNENTIYGYHTVIVLNDFLNKI